MDVLSLVRAARAAGLDVSATDGRLRIRGPKAADDLVRELGRRKTDVLAVLATAEPCRLCHERRWWMSRWDVVVCGVCHPPADGALERWLNDSDAVLPTATTANTPSTPPPPPLVVHCDHAQNTPRGPAS